MDGAGPRRRASSGELQVPESLHASLIARLDHLGSEARETAQAGSVIGRNFSYSLLSGISTLARMDAAVLALAYSENGQGGRPPFDPVMMFKILVIQAANNLSDGCAAPAQHSGGEESDQGGSHPRGLEGQTRQAPAEGPRRPLDGEVHQGKAERGRLNATARSGDPGLRVSKPCLDRLRLRLRSQMGGNRCGSLRGGPVA